MNKTVLSFVFGVSDGRILFYPVKRMFVSCDGTDSIKQKRRPKPPFFILKVRVITSQ